jgi:nuclear pore complex protein Nup133
MTSRRLSFVLHCKCRLILFFTSWDKIRQTRHVADAELVERFRRTALFAALVEVLSREHEPEGYHLYMSDALPTPLASEIASRWPGMSAEEVGGLAKDYVRESEQLKELDLEDVYNRVKELAFEFVDGGGVVGDGDVSDDPTEIVGEEMEDDVFR